MTLQRYLTWLVGLSTLPVLGLALWLGYAHFTDRRAAEDGRAVRLAERLAHDIDHDLQARMHGLQLLARSSLVEPSRWPELRHAAAGFREGFGGELLVVDAQRQWRLHTAVPAGQPLPPLPRPTGRSAVETVLATGRPAVGDPFQGPIAGEPVIAVGVPLREGSQVAFVVLNVVPLRRFDRLFAGVPIPEPWSAVVRDSQGREIWRSAPGGAPAAPPDDAPAVLRFLASPGHVPWRVEVEIPRTSYVQTLAGIGGGLLATLAGAVFVSVLVGRAGRRRLGRSVRALATVDGPGLAADDIDEFRHARRLLEQTIAARTAADDTVKVREGQLRGIFETATEAIVTTDAQQRIVLANPAAARVFGRPVDELVGSPLERLLPERHRAAHREAVDRFGRDRTGTRAMGTRSDVVGLRADGTEFPVEAAISQVHIDGQHLYTVILRDVTERREAEAVVASAKARLEAAIEGMHDGLVMLDTHARVVEMNSAYARMHGHVEPQHGRPGAEACEDLLDVETLDGTPVPPAQRACARALRGETGSGVELRVRRDGGGPPWIGSFSFGPVRDDAGHVIGAVVTVRDVTERLRLEQDLQASHAELAGLMAAQVGAEEGERRRIARELHDELQQVLAAIKMDARAIETQLADDPERVVAMATRIDDLATAAIVSSRRIVNDLRPLLLEELGLVAALRHLAQQFGERSGVHVAVEEDGYPRDGREAPEAIALCLYRVAQEALNNVGKHAGARRVRIVLAAPAEGGWRLAIQDDGRGMRPGDWRKPTSHGLRGMHERVRGLGGTLEIDGGPGRGVSITVVFPAGGDPAMRRP